ncbi:hypothetical protein IAU60_000260 [Kwoniella sp. DSM 27419]
MDFDTIPFEDIQWGHRLGAGSFGSVYKGSYLGIDIAIKEVLPSVEYDVHKYFEREWRIMRECRHPNIVLFLGLSKAPDDDGRVFIISEFVPRGNLRQYILSAHPFPWRLRLSFATDVARAVAYLHARQCIHRDLKGENLLITSNERIKVTDFGFARIASRNAEEMRRMTYCGTDGYMSPEIINGLEFDLPTDVFSLGIIFIEIMSRRLVDSKTYTRQAPHFVPDPSEIQRRATPGCPPAFINLALDCTLEDPTARPKMPEVLGRLREIEVEVLARLNDLSSEHVGSIRLVNRGGKRAMPIFDGGENPYASEVEGSKEEEDRMAEEDALAKLAVMTLDLSGDGASSLSSSTQGDQEAQAEKWRTARWDEIDSLNSFITASSEIKGHQPLLPSADSTSSFGSAGGGQSYSSFLNSSESATQAQPVQTASTFRDATPAPETEEDDAGSVMTIKGGPASPPMGGKPKVDPAAITFSEAPATEAATRPATSGSQLGDVRSDQPSVSSRATENVPILRKDQAPPRIEVQQQSVARVEAEMAEAVLPVGTASTVSAASKGGALGTHRFTLVDQTSAPLINGKKLSSNFTSTFTFAFLPRSLTQSPGKSSDALGMGKCAVCAKRVGVRPGLQCDDCQVIVHVKCSHAAPRNCTGGEPVV